MPSTNLKAMHLTESLILASFASIVTASSFSIPRDERNDGIHLAVHPQCGSLGGNWTDVNAGIDLWSMKTIVSFGVSVLSLFDSTSGT